VIGGLAQGPYVAARAGFEPMTLWTKGDESTNVPPRPSNELEDCVFLLGHIDSRPALIFL